MTVGEAIHGRRRALGLTLAQLSERTGVSIGWLSKIERGAGVHAATLEKVLDALGLRARLVVEVVSEEVARESA